MAKFNIFGKSNRNNINQQGHLSEHEKAPYYENPNVPSQKAVIYQSELDYISRCILDYPDIETGGQLFGFWTSTGSPVVLYVIGPGRNAQHNPTSFIQDYNYLQFIGNELYKRYGLQHIGEWHSHHQLGLAHPSGGDVNTMQFGVGKPGFPRLLLCIGNCTRTHTTVNPYNFHENNPREYSSAIWDIVNIESPFRKIVDEDLCDVLIHPLTRRASHGHLRTTRNIVQKKSTHIEHWLTESSENVETMKTFVSMVQSMNTDLTVKTEILESGEPLISIVEKELSIKLPYGFPVKSPILCDSQGREIYVGDQWELGEESLINMFGAWVTTTLSRNIGNETESKHTKEEFYGSIRKEQK